MSTLGSLIGMLGESQIRPWSQGVIEANRADTGLIELANLRRQQEAEAVARQAIQASGGRILGGGGAQSLLASPALTMAPGGSPMPALGPHPVTQQTVVPGQPPGAPQSVPGGMDLSQFASGSPPQSTLGSLAPTPPQDPMEALFRTNPDAALIIQKQQQAQQDRQWQIQEQQLTMREKVAGALGQIFQGVTDQASYDEARAQVQQFNPRLAAQLPPVYNKDQVQRLVKQAVDVKSSATLAIQNMQAQAEIGRFDLQRQQAGYAGLGTAVTDVLKGLTPEQVEKFGGRTSAAAIEYANKEVQRKKLEEAGEAERQKQLLGQQFQETQPLQDARKEDAGLFVYKGTGQGVPGTLPYGQVKTLQDEKDPEKGVIRLANLDEKKQLTTLKQLEPVMQQYADLVQYAYGTDPKTGKKGPLADYQRGPFQTIGAMWNQLSQDDPVFQAKRRALQGQLQSVVRGLGARGDLNAQELEAATQMLANMDASLGLGLSLGPMVGTGGIGVGGSIKPSINLPDTPETGINIANELIGTVNRRIGSILQHEGYQKTPYIRIRTDQETEAKPGEMPRATPPPKPGPEPVPTPGPPIFPKPQIRIPGEGPAPALPEVPAARPGMPPPPPTARSTPEEVRAYQEYQRQQRAVPGRQSQAPAPARPTRVSQLAGAPKFMNQSDVVDAMRQTGKSRAAVERRARELGYTVYGSKLPLPEVTMVG